MPATAAARERGASRSPRRGRAQPLPATLRTRPWRSTGPPLPRMDAFSQRVAPTVEMHLDSPFGDTEHGGDVRYRKIFVIVQGEHRGLAMGQRPHRVPELPRRLGNLPVRFASAADAC